MLDKDLLRRRIAFIRQGSETERFHTKRTIQKNDVGHHSYHVAQLALLIAQAEGATDSSKLRIVMAALNHDLAEHVTGDLPSPAKRGLGIREQFGRYEQELMAQVGLDVECLLSARETRILKMADSMEGAFFCISEAALGNQRFNVIFRNFWQYMSELEDKSECEFMIADYIMELWAEYGDDNLGYRPGLWSNNANEESVK